MPRPSPVMLDFFQQQTADQKQRALTEIAEHDADNRQNVTATNGVGSRS